MQRLTGAGDELLDEPDLQQQCLDLQDKMTDMPS